MAADTAASGFEHMGLDPRLLRAVAELGWATPTAIQAQAIPLALEGRDLLARARTGSGKTGAYGLPLLHKLLSIKEASPALPQAVRALVLVPSAELGRQVGHTLRQLSAFCARRLRVVDLCSQSDPAAQRPVLMEQPDVVVGTPGRVLAHLGGHSLSLRHSLELLVLDEADLLLSFGFGDDIKALLCHLPKIYQALLVSATFNPELEALQELVLHNPVLVLPPEPRLPGHSQLQQFQVRCGTEEDKFLVLVALLQLRLLRGRALLFVGSLARAFRLKLFLEQFGIPACTLNSELPAASRCHVIAQFNRGLYDFIVATDEEGPVETPQRQARKGGTPGKGKGKAKDKGKAKAQDPEYGVARGIDFQNVSAVINFDVPPTVESYIHRVGRTARGDNPGTALTLALPEEHEGLTRIEDALAGENGQSMLQPYKFCMEEIESLRYRCRDAMRSVTKQAVKEARLHEIRDELLNSEKLKAYFEDNPRDLHVLRHDKPLHPAIVKPHLRNVPDYLVPPSLRGIARPGPRKRKGPRVLRGPSARKGKPAPRGTGNPLQSFKFSRRGAKGRAVPTP
ncbi:probable ATP-dependent RNA helicase DDX56 isoform X1 [Neopelma chrysocephalum]|uniref:probable ATP-dependent RNA helicase DDX56 isoform X1 n=1 Tax=Neopelma chrysocephalum TaxID=114329 RepID=UPI000FCD3742|nr:probable ATP-dependent RNA helicase DDX56 isoform X1 [Neopelma chrysocephalum]